MTGVESQPKLVLFEDATALSELRVMQALQQTNLRQQHRFEARSEGYETMTMSSTPLCEVMMQIVPNFYFFLGRPHN